MVVSLNSRLESNKEEEEPLELVTWLTAWPEPTGGDHQPSRKGFGFGDVIHPPTRWTTKNSVEPDSGVLRDQIHTT